MKIQFWNAYGWIMVTMGSILLIFYISVESYHTSYNFLLSLIAMIYGFVLWNNQKIENLENKIKNANNKKNR